MGTADSLGARRGLARLRRPLVAATCALAALVLVRPLTPVVAQAFDPTAAGVSGVVFEDTNGNGGRDSGERGIADVSVSDGATTVATDKDGHYALDLDVDRRLTDIVYVSKPAGFAVPVDAFKTPQFYKNLGQLADGATAEANFGLRPDPRSKHGDFTFANVADTHVNPNLASQLAQINETSQDLAFVQVSGDLTNNATDAEFQYYRNATAASKLPVWPAVGNHEYFNGGGTTYPDRIENYRRYVGPEWYSFDYGDRHFVVLENNGAAPFEEQHAWLLTDLATHASDKRVVVLMHQPMNIPFGSPSEYDAYQEAFEKYDTELVLVGHEHSNQADLSWVKGARHVQTNSSSYTIDHSPRGFRYVHMRGNGSDNPFRMYGVERSLTLTNPGPGAEVSARSLSEIQVNAYHTTDVVRQVRFRLDGAGTWSQLKRSGDFTWYAAVSRLGPVEGHALGRDPGGRRRRRALADDQDLHRDGRGTPRREARGGLAAVPRRPGPRRGGRRGPRTQPRSGVDLPDAGRDPHGLAGCRGRHRVRRHPRRERPGGQRRPCGRREDRQAHLAGADRRVGARHAGGRRRPGVRADDPRRRCSRSTRRRARWPGSDFPSRVSRRSTSGRTPTTPLPSPTARSTGRTRPASAWRAAGCSPHSTRGPERRSGSRR